MSENEKQGQENEFITDETKVLPLAQIDAQMKDAYKLLQKAQPKAGESMEAVEDIESNTQETQKTPTAGNQTEAAVEANVEEASISDAAILTKEEATPKEAEPLTLEEKRRQQREQKMTIEERLNLLL